MPTFPGGDPLVEILGIENHLSLLADAPSACQLDAERLADGAGPAIAADEKGATKDAFAFRG